MKEPPGGGERNTYLLVGRRSGDVEVLDVADAPGGPVVLHMRSRSRRVGVVVAGVVEGR